MALLSSCGSPALVVTTTQYCYCSSRELVVTSLASFPSKKPSSGASIGWPPADHKWRARISFFPAFLQSKGKKDPETLKQEPLDAISSLDRGADATPEDQQAVDQIARKLEAVSPVRVCLVPLCLSVFFNETAYKQKQEKTELLISKAAYKQKQTHPKRAPQI